MQKQKTLEFCILYVLLFEFKGGFYFEFFLIKRLDNTLESYRMGNTWMLELLNSSVW